MRKLLTILSIVVTVICSCNRAEKEEYILPNGYMGNIVIFSNVKTGEPPKYLGKKRVYEISSPGTLITQFKKDYGLINKVFRYENGRKIEGIPYQEEKKSLDSNKRYAFYGNGFNITFKNAKEKIGIEILTICTPGQYERYLSDPFIHAISNGDIKPEDLSYQKLQEKKSAFEKKE